MGTQRGGKVKYGSFKRTSEFDLEIDVCFVENWNLFSKIGICFAKWGFCFQDFGRLQDFSFPKS